MWHGVLKVSWGNKVPVLLKGTEIWPLRFQTHFKLLASSPSFTFFIFIHGTKLKRSSDNHSRPNATTHILSEGSYTLQIHILNSIELVDIEGTQGGLIKREWSLNFSIVFSRLPRKLIENKHQSQVLHNCPNYLHEKQGTYPKIRSMTISFHLKMVEIFDTLTLLGKVCQTLLYPFPIP